MGKTSLEQARIEMIVDALQDALETMVSWFVETEESIKVGSMLLDIALWRKKFHYEFISPGNVRGNMHVLDSWEPIVLASHEIYTTDITRYNQ